MVLHPEGSHLSFGVYSNTLDEDSVFRAVFDVVQQNVSVDHGFVQSISAGDPVVGGGSEVEQRVERVDDLSSIPLPYAGGVDRRIIVVTVQTEELGPVAVHYARAATGDRHPVSAYWGADVLGIPPWLWSSQDRREAREMNRIGLKMFRESCQRVGALYGNFCGESPHQSPAQIVAEPDVWGAIFLSRSLLGSNIAWIDEIRKDYGQNVVEEWSEGYCVDGRVEFGETAVTFDNSSAFHRRIGAILQERLRVLGPDRWG